VNMASLFQKEFTVASYELDPRGQVRLTTLANYFQEIAYHHAKELNFGYEVMKERRTMWLLSRMKIRVDRYPEWNDRIMVETWPSGVDKLFAVRDFRVLDDAGGVLGVASTHWLIVDLETHRPVRPREQLERYARITYSEPVFETGLEKIGLPDRLEVLDRHRVLYSDLDIVGHVNNVKYMEWCIDAAMKGQSPHSEICEFEINYMQEAHFGEEITIFGGRVETGIPGVSGRPAIPDPPDDPNDPNDTNDTNNPNVPGNLHTLLFSAMREADGREVCRARLTWCGRSLV
jgi:medium-chain acyl-[acyl-carrier-protein] hydrolase